MERTIPIALGHFMRGLLVSGLLVGCSGADATPAVTVQEDPASAPEATREEAPTEPAPDGPAPADPPAVDPAPEGEVDGAPCGSDDECVIATPCCGCPRIPVPMHVLEADAMRERCARVRCAACALEPLPGPAQRARCVDARCVARPESESPSPRCTSDAQCALHVPCCTCEPRAMHVESIAVDQARCARRSCMGCSPSDGPAPSGARCEAGDCVPVP